MSAATDWRQRSASDPLPTAGYGYRAFDGQNIIRREGLDKATFRQQWSNLVVMGYKVESWLVTPINENEAVAMADPMRSDPEVAR